MGPRIFSATEAWDPRWPSARTMSVFDWNSSQFINVVCKDDIVQQCSSLVGLRGCVCCPTCGVWLDDTPSPTIYSRTKFLGSYVPCMIGPMYHSSLYHPSLYHPSITWWLNYTYHGDQAHLQSKCKLRCSYFNKCFHCWDVCATHPLSIFLPLGGIQKSFYLSFPAM
jgi:hypothetical protein